MRREKGNKGEEYIVLSTILLIHPSINPYVNERFNL